MVKKYLWDRQINKCPISIIDSGKSMQQFQSHLTFLLFNCNALIAGDRAPFQYNSKLSSSKLLLWCSYYHSQEFLNIGRVTEEHFFIFLFSFYEETMGVLGLSWKYV